MGGATSTNISTQAVDSLMSVINESTATTRSVLNQSQLLNAHAKNGSTIVIDQANLRQAAQINVAGYQQIVSSTNLDAKVREAAEQLAKTQTQMFSLSSAQSKNISNAYINLGQQVVNAARSECSNITTQTGVVDLSAVDSSTVVVGTLNWEQTFNGIVNCVQKASNVSSAKAELDQALKQAGISKVESPFGSLAIIIIAIVLLVLIGGGIALYFLFKTSSSNANALAGALGGSGAGASGSSGASRLLGGSGAGASGSSSLGGLLGGSGAGASGSSSLGGLLGGSGAGASGGRGGLAALAPLLESGIVPV